MSYFENSDQVESTWSKIMTECYVNTIFITPEWQGTWWNRFRSDTKPVIEILASDGNTIGILPLLLEGKEATFSSVVAV